VPKRPEHRRNDEPKSNPQLQAEHIVKTLGGPDRVGIKFSDTEPREIQYLYRKGFILVRDEYEEQIERLIRPQEGASAGDGAGDSGDADRRTEPTVEPVVRGVRLIRLTGVDTFTALDRIENGFAGTPGLGPGAAAPDHVVSISGDAGTCPADEPEPLQPGSAPLPGLAADRFAGDGVKVVVIDTGLDTRLPILPSWLHGVTGEHDPHVTFNGHAKILEKYAGHGTFIAGLVRAVAPQAEVRVLAGFDRAGATWESTLVGHLERALEQEAPDIISMSAGTRAYAGGLLAFQVFNENRLSHHKGVALVVAAGNDGERVFFWPAAAPYTVSVGALAPNWRDRASFSNFGGWVDVYAPGEDLVNAFPDGEYTYHEEPFVGRVESFRGMAMWSGTSFSTPIVAGLIAARMSRTGENGRDAAAALMAQARVAAVPGTGAILLP
jgi:subtilisin family serine protease